MFGLFNKGRMLNIDIDLLVDLYDKIVMPVSLYESEIWGIFGSDIFARNQLKYYKYMFKLNKSTSTNMILGELGQLPTGEMIRSRILIYWFKFVANSNNKK